MASPPPPRPASQVGPAIARALALFLGGFSLLNLLGDHLTPGFDANEWWIDLRPSPRLLAQPLLLLASLFLLAYALRPRMAPLRRRLTRLCLWFLLSIVLLNILTFYLLLARHTINAGFPIPFSLSIGLALGIILDRSRLLTPPRFTLPGRLLAALVFLSCLVGFPLAQMLCYGKTDYRRPADALVVFGARTYADGTPSEALADRVLTACRLYHAHLAPLLIMSGGPGDGPIDEPHAMRTLALQHGVPPDAILLDPAGLNTDRTIHNTAQLRIDRHLHRLLAVSHFYHLPRIKMTAQRANLELYTVPAHCDRTLSRLPFLLFREILALWTYYLRPLTPS